LDLSLKGAWGNVARYGLAVERFFDNVEARGMKEA
jgi:hypothetical protein